MREIMKKKQPWMIKSILKSNHKNSPKNHIFVCLCTELSVVILRVSSDYMATLIPNQYAPCGSVCHFWDGDKLISTLLLVSELHLLADIFNYKLWPSSGPHWSVSQACWLYSAFLKDFPNLTFFYFSKISKTVSTPSLLITFQIYKRIRCRKTSFHYMGI